MVERFGLMRSANVSRTVSKLIELKVPGMRVSEQTLVRNY